MSEAAQVADADRVLGLLRSLADIGTVRGPVDELTHSLQTATRAERAGADTEVVVAALLHDVGKAISRCNHGAVASELLRPHVRDDVYWMVRAHCDFMASHRPAPDRTRRWRHRLAPWYGLAGRFADEWDAPSFDPGYDSLPLEHFEPAVREVFGRQVPESRRHRWRHLLHRTGPWLRSPWSAAAAVHRRVLRRARRPSDHHRLVGIERVFICGPVAILVGYWEGGRRETQAGARVDLRRVETLVGRRHRAGAQGYRVLPVGAGGIWRADLFVAVDHPGGSRHRYHYHPGFAGGEVGRQAFSPELTEDPVGWTVRQLSGLRPLLVQSGAADLADRVDYEELARVLPAVRGAIEDCMARPAPPGPDHG